MDLGLDGRVAFVGGASKGIGKAVALGLAQEGAKLAICSRNEEALEQVVREIAQISSAEVLTVPGDLSQYQTIKDVIRTTAEHYSRLDIVFANAGGPPIGRAETTEEEDWEVAIQGSLLFCVRMAREAIPHMRKNSWGRIINTLSITTKQPMDNLMLSTATRMGVVGFAKTLADEVGKYNILVNNVLPGYILTERHRTASKHWAETRGITIEEFFVEQAKGVPLRRQGQPEEVANLVIFLASEKASYITGTSIEVDGGEARAMF